MFFGIDGVMSAFSAANLKVVGSSPANASLIPEISILDVQLKALSTVEPHHGFEVHQSEINVAYCTLYTWV